MRAHICSSTSEISLTPDQRNWPKRWAAIRVKSVSWGPNRQEKKQKSVCHGGRGFGCRSRLCQPGRDRVGHLSYSKQDRLYVFERCIGVLHNRTKLCNKTKMCVLVVDLLSGEKSVITGCGSGRLDMTVVSCACVCACACEGQFADVTKPETRDRAGGTDSGNTGERFGTNG